MPEMGQSRITSKPAPDGNRVLNIYIDKDGKVLVEYEKEDGGMAIQSMQLDPNAQAYTDDEIVGKVNAATDNIVRASSVEPSARPLEASEVTNTELDSTAARDNLDALADTARGYVQTNPEAGEFPVKGIQRQADGQLDIDFDDQAV